MAALPRMAVPAPKGPAFTYEVPDVSQWQPWLDPPPRDRRVGYPSRRRVVEPFNEDIL